MFNRTGIAGFAATSLWLAGATGALAQDGFEPEATDEVTEPVAADQPSYDEPAYQEPAYDQGQPGATAWESQAAPPPGPAGRVDGARFRGGVSLTGGAEFIPGGYSYTARRFGVDGRLGVQINHLFGIYAAPHLAFGRATEGGLSAINGTFSLPVMGEVTLADTFFIGAGFGYSVINAVGGPTIAARVGAYPVKSAPSDRARRQGLAVSFEMRTILLGSIYGAAMQAMFAIGYDAF
jgi:hypothetical protein